MSQAMAGSACRGFHIPPARQAALKNYKYAGTDKSIVSRYLLTPYWNKLVTLFPTSIAPNLITLIGLSFIMVNFITLLIVNPSLQCVPKPLLSSQGGSWSPIFPPDASFVSIRDELCPPTWVWFSFAVGLFLYQSFDAIDGKQARRTGTSGPLGEMFDHGCDALNTTLEVVLCAAALNLGQSWWTVASQIATLANFYLTTWEEYHTSVLYLSRFSGPVEGILIIVFMYFVTAFKGPAFWDTGILTVSGLESLQSLGIKNVPLNDCFLTMSAFGLVANILASSRNVIRSRKQRNLDIWTPFLGLAPFVLCASLNVVYLYHTPYILRNHLVLYISTWGINFAYQVGLIIVGHVTKSPFPMFPISTIFPLVGVLDSFVLPQVLNISSILNGTEQGQLLWVYLSFIISAAIYSFFVWDVINTVCNYFGINCLTLKKKNM